MLPIYGQGMYVRVQIGCLYTSNVIYNPYLFFPDACIVCSCYQQAFPLLLLSISYRSTYCNQRLKHLLSSLFASTFASRAVSSTDNKLQQSDNLDFKTLPFLTIQLVPIPRPPTAHKALDTSVFAQKGNFMKSPKLKVIIKVTKISSPYISTRQNTTIRSAQKSIKNGFPIRKGKKPSSTTAALLTVLERLMMRSICSK